MIKNHELQDDVTLCTTVPRVRGELLSLRVGGVGCIFCRGHIIYFMQSLPKSLFRKYSSNPPPPPPWRLNGDPLSLNKVIIWPSLVSNGPKLGVD